MNDSRTIPTIERLAKGYYGFLRDSSTSNGSQIAKTPRPDTVSYEVFGYQIETVFTGKYQCELTVTNKLKLEELLSVPYNNSSEEPEPNWESFYEGIFTLIKEKRLANSE